MSDPEQLNLRIQLVDNEGRALATADMAVSAAKGWRIYQEAVQRVVAPEYVINWPDAEPRGLWGRLYEGKPK